MNRQMKRALQRQGQLDQDGNPARQQQAPRPAPRPKEDRASPAQYVREVRAELRKVAWPTRDEVVKYSLVVLFALVIVTTMILGLDWLFTEFVFFLFD